MAENLEDEIRENAKGPAKASGDAGSVEQHKLTDQIAADKPPRTKLSSKRLARDRFSQVLVSKAVADFESPSVAREANATASETATGWLTVRSRSC